MKCPHCHKSIERASLKEQILTLLQNSPTALDMQTLYAALQDYSQRSVRNALMILKDEERVLNIERGIWSA